MEQMQKVALDNYGTSLEQTKDFPKENGVQKKGTGARKAYRDFSRQIIEEIGAHEFVSTEITERFGAFYFIDGEEDLGFQPKGLSDLNTGPNETEDALIALIDAGYTFR